MKTEKLKVGCCEDCKFAAHAWKGTIRHYVHCGKDYEHKCNVDNEYKYFKPAKKWRKHYV